MSTLRILILAVGLAVTACDQSETPPIKTAPSPQPQSQSQPEIIDISEVLKAQLDAAAKMASEGRLEAAIRQIEVSQLMLPDVTQLDALHASLVQRRDAAIRDQLARPAIVLNRSQMSPVDQIQLSLLIREWNASLESKDTARVPYFRSQLAPLLVRYPELVEARLLQARMALMDDNAAEGHAAGGKLASWKWDARHSLPQDQQQLIEALQAKSWYIAAVDPTSAESALDRIRNSLKQ